MSLRPYILCDTNWKTIEQVRYQVAVLPWGATEAHNYHLPYGTDNIQCDYIAAESARMAWEKGAKVIVLPTIPFGVNTGQLDIPFVINMNPSTQTALLFDVVDTLCRQGLSKLVILNGHGGNDFKQMIREIQPNYPSMFITSLNWYQIKPESQLFKDPGDHGGEMETSNMMFITPDRVLPLEEAGEGEEKKFKFKAIREGWSWAQRDWRSVSRDTGIGNPKQASTAKGKIYLKYITEQISQFLIEVADSDLNDLYE
jgi:creatinine amidohydrolase